MPTTDPQTDASAREQNPDAMVVSVHIPKTAGTTLGMLLEDARPGRVFFDYRSDGNGKGYVPKPEHIQQLADHLPFIRHFFDVIHGHFRPGPYAELLGDAILITCLRDPIERLISHYRHYLHHFDCTGPGLIRFAREPHVRYFQCRFLEGLSLERFACVLITERLDESILNLNDKCPQLALRPENVRRVPRLNTGDNRRSPSIRPGFFARLALRFILRKEYRLYRKALRRHRRELRRLRRRRPHDVRCPEQPPPADAASGFTRSD